MSARHHKRCTLKLYPLSISRSEQITRKYNQLVSALKESITFPRIILFNRFNSFVMTNTQFKDLTAMRTFVSAVPTAQNPIKPTPLSETPLVGKLPSVNDSDLYAQPRKTRHSAEEIAPDDGTVIFESCLVRVLRIVQRQGKEATYKTVKVKQEMGYWLRTFRFNIFSSHPLYNTIKEDMKLDVKVISFDSYSH